jgi:hypothetical protein
MLAATAAQAKRGVGRPRKTKDSILPARRPNASERAERERGGKKEYDAPKFREARDRVRNKELSIAEAVREYAPYGVKRTTLVCAVRGITSPSKPPGPTPTLGRDLEDALADWVTQMALRLQITRRTVLTLPQATDSLATPAPSRPAHIDLAPTADEADETDTVPVGARGQHHRKITVARWLTHDESLEAFREKEGAKAAKAAAKALGRGRGRPRGSGRGSGRGRGRSAGGAAAVESSGDDGSDDSDDDSDASEEYVPKAIHGAKMGRPANKRKAVELFQVEWEDFPDPISFTWEPRENLSGYVALVDAFVDAWRADGNPWPPTASSD